MQDLETVLNAIRLQSDDVLDKSIGQLISLPIFWGACSYS
jgi:hypothetical protein